MYQEEGGGGVDEGVDNHVERRKAKKKKDTKMDEGERIRGQLSASPRMHRRK